MPTSGQGSGARGAAGRSDGAQNRFLLTNLAILFVFILALIVLLAAYPTFFAPEAPASPTPRFVPSRTATSTVTTTPTVTLTPTITHTPRPTFTSTVTQTPTETPTPAATSTFAGPPTLTPARPVLGYENYRLRNWSAEQAQQIVEYMDAYPDSLPRQSRGENDENYYSAFRYAAIAEAEALLRFPDDPQAGSWGWARAYNLARMGDAQAGGAYADLITQALNRAEVAPADLPRWFRAKEPRLGLSARRLDSVPGFLSGYLVSIEGNGGAQLLLLETHAGFQSQTLISDFNFIDWNTWNALWDDLTGDGVDEIVIYRANARPPYQLALPRIFSLADIPARELPFQPGGAGFLAGMEHTGAWTVRKEPEELDRLQFQDRVFPACPVVITRTYRWDGAYFAPESTRFEVQPDPNTLAFCSLVHDHAISNWGPEAAIQIMEPILPAWPPETQVEGKPFPPDARDEWRFRLGVYYALAGRPDEAQRYLNDLVAHPILPGSRWAAPARDFLQAYAGGENLYPACVQAEACSPHQALETLVRGLEPGDAPELVTILWEAGVDLRASGYFDFDGDEATEGWFTVRHRPGEKLEFWILMPYAEGIEPLFVGIVESNEPDLDYYEKVELLPAGQKLPVVLLEGGQYAFAVDRLPENGRPYLIPVQLPRLYPNRFNEGLERASQALFAGEDPEEVQAALLDLQENPGLLCRGDWSCDRYYYLLGVASELAGDIPTAVDSYLTLWWDYSRSPYTVLARLKLRGPAELPTATGTITRTPTPGPSPTATVTGTPPTATPTVTGTPPTSTPTPTVTGTPPTPTQTVTGTPPTPTPTLTPSPTLTSTP